MVLGHQRCGALTAALQGVDTATHDHGEIDYIVDTLKPAVRQAAAQPGDRLTNAVKANVALTVTALRRSPVIGPQEQAGKIKVVGAYYELDTGKVALI
jgi:carbonic anhydrase